MRCDIQGMGGVLPLAMTSHCLPTIDTTKCNRNETALILLLLVNPLSRCPEPYSPDTDTHHKRGEGNHIPTLQAPPMNHTRVGGGGEGEWGDLNP